MAAGTTIFAAQYLRMSTEHQQYSTENQALAIEAYAAAHGLEIVQTYLDTAKSGVVLRRRNGLQRLLQDVVRGDCRYRATLVYDESRWGRFQDTDEAAHYEFVCKSAGIPVHYCAETFENDGSMPSLIMKALKRTMAGEYSRELGSKVLAGQKRLARLGFKQGGRAGYGLRRVLVTPDGAPKQTLAFGERKVSRQTELFWSQEVQTKSSASVRFSECSLMKVAPSMPSRLN
jgi:DNA invertase Pin-like site-specific DNA recombinase